MEQNRGAAREEAGESGGHALRKQGEHALIMRKMSRLIPLSCELKTAARYTKINTPAPHTNTEQHRGVLCKGKKKLRFWWKAGGGETNQ